MRACITKLTLIFAIVFVSSCLISHEEESSVIRSHLKTLLSNSEHLKYFTLEYQSDTSALHQNIGGFKVNDKALGLQYSYVQTAQRIFVMANQTTIYKIVDISVPDIIFSQENCTKLIVHPSETFSVSACNDTSDGIYYLVVISYLSSGPFYAQSLNTTIINPTLMYITGNYLFVADPAAPLKLHIYKITLGLGGNYNQVLIPVNSTEYQDIVMNAKYESENIII